MKQKNPHQEVEEIIQAIFDEHNGTMVIAGFV